MKTEGMSQLVGIDAWDYNPDANLVNGLGLPASLFRTRGDN